jgi:hypothetical protein
LSVEMRSDRGETVRLVVHLRKLYDSKPNFERQTKDKKDEHPSLLMLLTSTCTEEAQVVTSPEE